MASLLMELDGVTYDVKHKTKGAEPGQILVGLRREGTEGRRWESWSLADYRREKEKGRFASRARSPRVL